MARCTIPRALGADAGPGVLPPAAASTRGPGARAAISAGLGGLVAVALSACAPTRPPGTGGSAATDSTTARAEAGAAVPGMSGRPDAQMQAVLDALRRLGAQPVGTLTSGQARRQPTPADAVRAVLQQQGRATAPTPVARVEDRRIPGAAGQIPARIYWPAGATGGQPLPVVLYIHGGGWVLADLDTYDATPRALANAARAIVVATHYRQAPEHKFPAAHDDTWAAYRWVLASAQSLGGDPARVAVAGESAGGNMAAAIAIRARDEGVRPPVHQLLVYPVADATIGSESERQNTAARPLDTQALPWFYERYLKSEQDGRNPLFSILSADVRGVAPATVITAQIDPLRSEGEAYARRLAAAGVPVIYRNFDGVTHEFFGMGAVLEKARTAVALGADGLRRGFLQAASAARPGLAPRG